ncbi:MAG: hypothetical protein ABMA26_11550 [Limisphaerales bacterium]
MQSAATIVRKLPLAQFPAFARNARAALSQSGIADLEHAGVFRSHIAARCCGCDTRPSPDVVAALFMGAALEVGRPADGLARLREEYCLRTDCESRFYELTFTPHPTVDWAAIQSNSQPDSPRASANMAVGGAVVRTTARVVRAQLSWKLAAAVALLIALLAWRQWWTGGSIPFFREAKTFTSEGVGPEPIPSDDGDTN